MLAHNMQHAYAAKEYINVPSRHGPKTGSISCQLHIHVGLNREPCFSTAHAQISANCDDATSTQGLRPASFEINASIPVV